MGYREGRGRAIGIGIGREQRSKRGVGQRLYRCRRPFTCTPLRLLAPAAGVGRDPPRPPCTRILRVLRDRVWVWGMGMGTGGLHRPVPLGPLHLHLHPPPPPLLLERSRLLEGSLRVGNEIAAAAAAAAVEVEAEVADSRSLKLLGAEVGDRTPSTWAPGSGPLPHHHIGQQMQAFFSRRIYFWLGIDGFAN